MIVSFLSYRNMSLLCGMFAFLIDPHALRAQRQMEVLGRGVVAVRVSSSQAYVNWRMLGTDPDEIGFNLYRSHNGGAAVKVNGTPITATTDYVDTPPSLTQPNTYFVRPVLGGIEQNPSGTFTVPGNALIPTDHQNNAAPYLSLPLQVPAGGTTPDGVSYTYSPNDCSVGDLDGDGEMEMVLKWDPSNSHDNAHDGYTGNVFIDAYEMDGTFLWRIDLGINVRAGAHYTQFMVYDLDGDGRSELACRTAPGTVDGLSSDVILPGDDPNADYRNSAGRVLSGPEYLTLFDGLTGAELVTTNFYPDRVAVSQWGDTYGNRVDRFLAGIAYVDGERPSLIMARGYYGPQSGGGQARNEVTAWNWRDGQFTMLWWFKAGQNINGNINSDYIGQGNHQLSVADVDADGKDEIIYGACSVDDDGSGLYTTGLHHGDALHASDMDPDRPGLEVWDVHEVASAAGGGELRDAANGNLIYGVDGTGDTGRGLAAHIDSSHVGYQMWSSVTAGVLDRTGAPVSANKPSINFVVWWDADLQRELLDNAGGGGTATKLDKWTGDGATRILSPYSVDVGAQNNNGTKSNPCLSGDILGDWREEMVFRSSDNASLMIFVTPHPATTRFRTFLHDAQYRVALAWQNVAYNQPPHPSFYVGTGMADPAPMMISDADRRWVGDGLANVWNIAGADNWRTNGVWTNFTRTTFLQGQSVLFDSSGSNNAPVVLTGSLQPAAVKVQSPGDYTFAGTGGIHGTASITKAGAGVLTLTTTNSFSGNTTVWEGGLQINGCLEQSLVTVKKSVWHDARVGGTGVLGGGLVMESGSSLVPGAGTGIPGTLTLSNALTLSGGVTHRIDLSDDPSGLTKDNDLIRVFGDVNASGLNTFEVTALDGSLTPGVYPLIEYSGTFNGGLANFNAVASVPGQLILTNSPGAISLVYLPPGPQSLVWRGGESANAWDSGFSSNWFNGAGLTTFTPDDSVTFDDTGSPNYSVGLVGGLAPSAINVTAAGDYAFIGSGHISGATGLIKSGSGTLSIASVHTYDGVTIINDGEVEVIDLGEGLLNRWSFNGTLADSVGGQTASIVDQGGNNATLGASQVTLTGGDKDTSDYVDLGDDVLPNGTTPVTIELWATPHSVQNWSRIWDFGASSSENLFMSWTRGTTLAQDRVEWLDAAEITTANDTCQPYALDVEFHVALMIQPGVGAGGTTRVTWYRGPSASGAIGPARGSFDTANTLADLGDVNCWLGRSQWPDNTANASYNEVRIWNRALSAAELQGLHAAGPDATLVGGLSALSAVQLSGATARLANRSGIMQTVGSLAGVSGSEVVLASGGLIVGGDNASTGFGGGMSGPGTFTKVGTGKLTLSGANTHTGATTVMDGTLNVEGSLGTTRVLVQSGATLSGVGSMGGIASVDGQLAPGASIGTLTFGSSLTLGPGSTSLFEISKPPVESDQAVVGGTVTYGGALSVVKTGAGAIEVGDAFQLFSASTYAGTFAVLQLPALPSGLEWATGGLSTNGTISVISLAQPLITGYTFGGGNLAITGTGGTAGGAYRVLAATDLALSRSSWIPVQTNSFDGSGAFTFAITVDPNVTHQFFMVEIP